MSSDSCPQTLSAVYKCLGCSPSCGRCLAAVRAILNENLEAPAVEEKSFCTRIEDAARRPVAFSRPVSSLEPNRIAACDDTGRRRLFAII